MGNEMSIGSGQPVIQPTIGTGVKKAGSTAETETPAPTTTTDTTQPKAQKFNPMSVLGMKESEIMALPPSQLNEAKELLSGLLEGAMATLRQDTILFQGLSGQPAGESLRANAISDSAQVNGLLQLIGPRAEALGIDAQEMRQELGVLNSRVGLG